MAPRVEKSSRWTDGLPYWLQSWLPVLLGVALVGLFFLAAVFVRGSPSREVGATLSGFGLVESEQGASTFGYVQLDDGRQAQVALPREHNCRIGARMILREQDGVFSKQYVASPFGCRDGQHH